MCIYCKFDMAAKVGGILSYIQFAIWFVSAGIYVSSAGRFGTYPERYTRLALMFLIGTTFFIYLTKLGMMLGSSPDSSWPDLVVHYLTKLMVSDYAQIEHHTPKMYINYSAIPDSM